MSQLAEVIKEMEASMAWQLNKLLRNKYRQLYIRLGFSEQIDQAHAEQPGYEVAELILRITRRDGMEGFYAFYKLLEELEEKESLKLINDNPVVGAVANKFLNAPSPPNLSNTNPLSLVRKRPADEVSDTESKPTKRHKSSTLQLGGASSALQRKPLNNSTPPKVRSVGDVPIVSDTNVIPPGLFQQIEESIRSHNTALVKGYYLAANTLILQFLDTQNYVYKVWINAASEQSVLQSFGLMMQHFNLVGNQCLSLKALAEDDAIQILVEIFQKFSTAIIFYNCEITSAKITPIYDILSPTNQLPFIVASVATEQLIFKCPIVNAVMHEQEEKEQLFLELMAFANKTTARVSWLRNSKVVGTSIQEDFKTLLSSHLIEFTENEDKVIVGFSALKGIAKRSSQRDEELFDQWTTILRSANELHTNNQEKMDRNEFLSSIGKQHLRKMPSKLKENFLVTVIEFLCSWRGAEQANLHFNDNFFGCLDVKEEFFAHFECIYGLCTLLANDKKNVKRFNTVLSVFTVRSQDQMKYLSKLCFAMALINSEKDYQKSSEVLRQWLDPQKPVYKKDHPLYLHAQLLFVISQQKLNAQVDDEAIEMLKTCYETRHLHRIDNDEFLAEVMCCYGKIWLSKKELPKAKDMFLGSLQTVLSTNQTYFHNDFMIDTAACLLLACEGTTYRLLCSGPTGVEALPLPEINCRVAAAKLSKCESYDFKRGNTLVNIADRTFYEVYHKGKKSAILIWKPKLLHTYAVYFTKRTK
jgi:hypothetical protein